MIRFILVALLALVMFLPVAQAEEQFECLSCYSGTYTVFHGSNDLILVMSFQLNGILMSHSKNKFLDNATYHCEGVQRGLKENKRVFCYCRNTDPDGDIIIEEWTANGMVGEGKYIEGTGKYKGIKGSYKSEPLARGKPAMPGTFQECNKMTGTYELAK